jgi:hypothetical protein
VKNINIKPTGTITLFNFFQAFMPHFISPMGNDKKQNKGLD